ncbi:MAG: phospholipase D-like domain-containing protein [Phycisphaeraceae bacterium]
MDTRRQHELDDALQATLHDGRLSGAEERALRALIETLSNEREALAFVRNRAFNLARERIQARPLDTLRWLERIDKMIDNTASPPTPGGRGHGRACAFSPGESGLNLILRELRSAKQSLDICVFTITDDRITSAITDAHRRGVAVRLVTDNDKQFDTGSDIDRLVRAGVPTRFDPDRDHMHHKFAIADGERLLNGSYNWTRGATRNHENITVVTDGELVNAFSKEFDQLWRVFRERR